MSQTKILNWKPFAQWPWGVVLTCSLPVKLLPATIYRQYLYQIIPANLMAFVESSMLACKAAGVPLVLSVRC